MVKRTFGTWITRLLRGGKSLTDAEYRLLCALVGELPAHLRGIVERQFELYNLVQRENDGRALNFYRVRLGRSGVLPVTPLLRSKLDVAPLVRISARITGEIEPLHAVLTAVNGRAFSVSFSRAVAGRLKADALAVAKVTQAWKSNFGGEQVAAEQASCQPPNKQFQRTVIRHRGRAASASLHCTYGALGSATHHR